jgi:hypothetical protein
MGNKVFANGRELSCKAADGKSICAFPDVCMTPPENPATPPGVPVPYPNTGMAKDTAKGSKNVKISGKEVMLKDKSHYKKSVGDEAGCAAKKGVINGKISGKVFFTSWSMDVKIEGENAVRHLDTTTGNHSSPTANAAIPWPNVDSQDAAVMKDCQGDVDKEKEACQDYKPHKADGKDVCAEAGVAGSFSKDKTVAAARSKSASKDKCSAARRCRLVPYNAKPADGITGCCPAQTGDHIVPKSSFFKKSVNDGANMDGWGDYNINKAPCMCLEGGSCSGSHGLRHAHHKALRSPDVAKLSSVSFDSEVKHCAKGAKAVAPQCNEACLEAQLKEGHKGMGDPKQPIKYSPTGKNFAGKTDELLGQIGEMLPSIGPAGP